MMIKATVFTSILALSIILFSQHVYARNLSELTTRMESNISLPIRLIDAERGLLTSRQTESLVQKALLQTQIEKLALDISINETLREQQLLIERHLLQREYYHMALMINQLALVELELQIINRQISIETHRHGYTTRVTIDGLNNERRRIEDRKAALERSIEEGRNAIRVRLNVDSNYSLPDSFFSIPETLRNITTYTLNNVRQGLLENNTGYLMTREHIRLYTELLSEVSVISGRNAPIYLSTRAELSRLNARRNLTVQNLEAHAERQFNIYLQNLDEYNTAILTRDTLIEQLDLARSFLDSGRISDLDHLIMRYNTLLSLHNVDITIVNILNSLSAMELLINGIVLE